MRVIVCCAFISCFFLFPTTSASFQAVSQEVHEEVLTIGTTFHISSTIWDNKREINVWLPPGYTTQKKTYSVLYVIDGGREQDFHHISGLAQLATINASFEEMIAVGIKTENRMMELAHKPSDSRYISEPPKAGKSDLFLKHIADEVIPFVEKKYRTGSRRAVIGESLAGLFILEVFLKNPNVFTDYIAISPSLWWDDKALAKAALELISKHDSQPRKLYVTIANEGGTMQRGLDLILEAVKTKKPAGLELFYVDRSATEIHQTIFHPAAHDAFLKLFGFPRPEFGTVPWYLREGGQPPSSESTGKKKQNKDGGS